MKIYGLKTTLLVIGLAILLFGDYTFWVGWHNIDVCHNELMISGEFGLEIKEIRTDGKVWGLHECYMTGLNQTLYGKYIIMIGMLFLSISIANIVYRR